MEVEGNSAVSSVCVLGGSGLLGRALCESLRQDGIAVTVYSRASTLGREGWAVWDPASATIDEGPLAAADAVVNLAGENLAEGRWTPERKQALRDSRVDATQLLARTLARLPRKPQTLINASAVGFYGHRGDEAVDEQSPPGRGFLANLCRDWEGATEPATRAGIRVICLRLGVIMTPEGGALKKMLLPFKLGLGAQLGNGEQYMPWITLRDAVGVIRFALEHRELHGAVNAVAPEPVTNRAFTAALGHALRRPAFMRLPSFAVRAALGEMGEEALLPGANARPRVLERAGYRFEFSRLEDALSGLLREDG